MKTGDDQPLATPENPVPPKDEASVDNRTQVDKPCDEKSAEELAVEQRDSGRRSKEENERAKAKFVASKNENGTIFQISIDNMFGDIGNIGRELNRLKESAPKAQNQKYDLSVSEQCITFVQNYRDSPYLAYAIVMGIFEGVLTRDLQDLSSKLLRRLPETYDEAGNPRQERADPYLAVGEILGVIGGQIVTLTEGEAVVFAGNARDIFRNLWAQFPSFHTEIVEWLFDVSDSYKHKPSFGIAQIARAFANVVRCDFGGAKDQIFDRLISNKENIYLLGAISTILYQDYDFSHSMDELLRQWAQSDSGWLWRIPCLVYLSAGETGENKYKPKLEKALGRSFDDDHGGLEFVGTLLIYSRELRSLVTKELNRVCMDSSSHGKTAAIADTYINLLFYGYCTVSSEYPVLPLAACDCAQQQKDLAPALGAIFNAYDLRQRWFALLAAYLDELKNYTSAQQSITKWLCAYFYNAVKETPRYYADIQRFLQGCMNSTAREISLFLENKFINSAKLQIN